MDPPHSPHAPVKRLVGFIVPGEDTTIATTRHPPSFGFRLSDFGLLSAFGLRPSDFAAKSRPCHVTPRPPNASNSLATSPLWRCQTETEPQQRCRSADTGAPEQHPWNGENSRGPIEDQSRPAVAYLAIPWLFLRCLPTIPTPSNPPKATGGPPLVSGPYTWSFHGARIG
jgi:hypothetical protein